MTAVRHDSWRCPHCDAVDSFRQAAGVAWCRRCLNDLSPAAVKAARQAPEVRP